MPSQVLFKEQYCTSCERLYFLYSTFSFCAYKREMSILQRKIWLTDRLIIALVCFHEDPFNLFNINLERDRSQQNTH